MAKSISIQGKNIIIFYCSSLKTLGLESRVSLTNKMGENTTTHVQIFTVKGEYVQQKTLVDVAMKSRGVYETPDGTILLAAH